MKEQRTYTRFNIEGEVVLMPQDGTPCVINATLSDISFVGIAMCAQQKINPGTKVKFELTTKFYHGPVIGEGNIGYAKRIKKANLDLFRIGMDFSDINKHAITQILSLIQRDLNAQIIKKQSF